MVSILINLGCLALNESCSACCYEFATYFADAFVYVCALNFEPMYNTT